MLFIAYEIIVVQGTALMIDQYRDFRSLFTGMTASVYVLVGNITAYITYALTEQILLSVFVQLLIHIVILYVLLQIVHKSYQEEQAISKKIWSGLCVFPILLYLIVSTLAGFPEHLLELPKNIISIFLVLLLIPFSYILITLLFQKLREEAELQRNNEFLESFADRLKHETVLMEENQTQTAILRHDMRHRATLIASYLDNEQYDEIRQVLMDMNDSIERLKPKRFCENIAVNGILTNSCNLAKKDQVQMEINASLPAELAINEYELITVVSNLLENAVQVAAKVKDVQRRKVNLKLLLYKEQIILEIDNTFDEPCEIDRTTGLPKSSNGVGHGLGLRSVVTFAKKYNATFDYSIEKDHFIVRLLV